MTNDTTLVIATRNKGKIAELKNLLQGYPVVLKDLGDFGPIPDVIEDGDTFDENAYKKASFTAKFLGLPAMPTRTIFFFRALLIDASPLFRPLSPYVSYQSAHSTVSRQNRSGHPRQR